MNRTDGGDTCPVLSAEEKARVAGIVSRTHKGRPKSEEHRRNIGAAQKGKIIPPETRAKMSAAGKVKVFTPAHRAAMSATRLGRKPSAETIEKGARARLKSYILISPTGECVSSDWLAEFCRTNGIKSRGNLLGQSKKGLRSEGWFIASEAYPEPRASRQGQRG